MKRTLITLLVLVILAVGLVYFFTSKSTPTQTNKANTKALGLKTVLDIPLSGNTDRLDYQSINYDNQRLYISHLGSSLVHVFDLTNQKVLADISGLSNPYGILAVPSLKKVYVSEGGGGAVAVIDENSLKVVKHIKAGTTPDGIAYDPNTNKIFVTNENSGNVTVINAVTDERIEDISVGGGVGNTIFDPVSKLIYSVSGNDDKLVEINPQTNKVVNSYKTDGCTHPHGFFIEEQTHYALITCQGNSALIVFDLNAKKIISSDTVGTDPDVLAYDPGLHHLYVAAENGPLTIFDIQKNKVTKIGQDFIADKAHTISVDKNTHKVYLPLENINGKPILRILEPIS